MYKNLAATGLVLAQAFLPSWVHIKALGFLRPSR